MPVGAPVGGPEQVTVPAREQVQERTSWPVAAATRVLAPLAVERGARRVGEPGEPGGPEGPEEAR